MDPFNLGGCNSICVSKSCLPEAISEPVTEGERDLSSRRDSYSHSRLWMWKESSTKAQAPVGTGIKTDLRLREEARMKLYTRAFLTTFSTFSTR